MSIRLLLAALLFWNAQSSSALACEWYSCDWSWYDYSYYEPYYEPYYYEPYYYEPEPYYYEPEPYYYDAWFDPGYVEPEPYYEPQAYYEPAYVEPEPQYFVPSGIYYVTEVYVADTVTNYGSVTTYETTSVAEDPGTYARVLESVGTGTTSAYDGSAFNGRAALTDGQQVAGTYYENFALTSYGFISTSIVFFQDDSELHLSAEPTPAPTPIPTPMFVAVSTPIPTASPPPIVPTLAPAPASVAPIVEVLVTPTPAWTQPPAAVPTSTPRPAPVIQAGLAIQPLGDALESVEVLRGRALDFWPVAIADGLPAVVTFWQLVPGEYVALGSTSGTGDIPARLRWDRLPEPVQSWLVQFDVTVLVLGESFPARAEINVAVRSPALVP